MGINKKEFQESFGFLSLELENKLDKKESVPFLAINQENKFNKTFIEESLTVEKTVELFNTTYKPFISDTSGPNYYGFVVGGSTPVALLGDWLTDMYNQISLVTPVTQQHEKDTIEVLKDFFELDEAFTGSFVTGFTMSNFVNLATARQWIGNQYNQDWALNCFSKPVKILTEDAHSSINF